MVTVVKIRNNVFNFNDYIGREWNGFPESPFHNPFHLHQFNYDRKEVILRFIQYWYAPEQKTLRELALRTIGPNALLGCWCHPLACHGDIIAGYVNWKNQEPELF